MKTINVTFTDEEHELLIETKGNLNWHDFILTNEDMKALIKFYDDRVKGDPAWDDSGDDVLKANGVYEIWKKVFNITEDEEDE